MDLRKLSDPKIWTIYSSFSGRSHKKVLIVNTEVVYLVPVPFEVEQFLIINRRDGNSQQSYLNDCQRSGGHIHDASRYSARKSKTADSDAENAGRCGTDLATLNMLIN